MPDGGNGTQALPPSGRDVRDDVSTTAGSLLLRGKSCPVQFAGVTGVAGENETGRVSSSEFGGMAGRMGAKKEESRIAYILQIIKNILYLRLQFRICG
jgi:hypothetical protein